MTERPIIIVKEESPVADKASKLFKWDSSVRKYHNEFELNIAALSKGISLLYQNPLTSFRDPTHFGHRYRELLILKHRQQLGDISASEVSEASSALFDGTNMVVLKSGAKGEPSHLFSYHLPILGAGLGLGLLMGLYGRFVRGTSAIWLAGGLIPFFLLTTVNKAR